jgi:hypothetical protein
MVRIKVKDFEFYAVDEESARFYCQKMAEIGKKATYRYKNGKFIITVWKQNQ